MNVFGIEVEATGVEVDIIGPAEKLSIVVAGVLVVNADGRPISGGVRQLGHNT